VSIPLNRPIENHRQIINSTKAVKDSLNKKQNISTKKAALLGALMLGSISFLYVSSTQYEPIESGVIFAAGIGGGAILGHEIAKGKIKRQRESRYNAKTIFSLNTHFIMEPQSNKIGENMVWQKQIVKAEDKYVNHGLADKALSGFIGYSLGSLLRGKDANSQK